MVVHMVSKHPLPAHARPKLGIDSAKMRKTTSLGRIPRRREAGRILFPLPKTSEGPSSALRIKLSLPTVAREVGTDLVPVRSSNVSPATLSSLMELQLCGLLSAPQTHFMLSPRRGPLRVLHPLLERLFPSDLLCWLLIF